MPLGMCNLLLCRLLAPVFPMIIFDPNVHRDGDSWDDAFFAEQDSFDHWIADWARGVNLWERAYGDDGIVSKEVAARESRIVAILEDNAERAAAMREAIVQSNQPVLPVFFNRADTMVDWLGKHLKRVDLISLDHDLEFITEAGQRSVDPGDGRDVATWLAGWEETCPVIIHTSNSVGADQMRFALEEAGWIVMRVYPDAGVEWVHRQWLETVVAILQMRSDRE